MRKIVKRAGGTNDATAKHAKITTSTRFSLPTEELVSVLMYSKAKSQHTSQTHVRAGLTVF